MTDAIRDLVAARSLDSPETIAAFEEAVSRLPKRPTGEEIEQLLPVFDDETAYPEVMFELLHVIEDADVGVEELAVARALPSLDVHSPWWSEVLVIRMLNNSASQPLLVEAALRNPPSKQALLKVLGRIAQGGDAVAGLAREAIAQLQSP